ncbi:MAG: nuclear transport factor 2 family protein [Bryobacteraceae bacterium]|jgi:ketosteroid isomerase-like protein
MTRKSSTGFTPVAVADSGAEKDVQAAMEAWREARLQQDRDALERLYAPDLVFSHSSGKVEDKEEAIDAVLRVRMDACELADVSVRVYGSTALVWARITLRKTTDGKADTTILSVLHIWVKSSPGWQMVARQATRLNPSTGKPA